MDPEDFEEYPYEVRRYKTMMLDISEMRNVTELEKKVRSRWHVNDVIKVKGNRLSKKG